MKTNKEIVKEAQDYFNKMINSSSEKEILEVKNSDYGFRACRFAIQFITPGEDQEAYSKIYTMFYNYFENYKK